MKREYAPWQCMATFISHSPAETESLGEAWGRTAPCGRVIALSGDLGAGKTQLVKGIARGLGVTARVHSPSFTLVNEYGGGRLRLFHLDLYRLETAEQIHSAGLEEYLQPNGVAVIEWAERLSALGDGISVLEKAITVRFEILSETERRIVYEAAGT